MAGPVIVGEHYRISVLTESLVRLEYSENGVFEDGQTQVVQDRDFGPVSCEITETEEVLDLHTEHLHLHFTPDRLFIELKGQYAVYGSRWHYGDRPETLKGTSRTLDEVDGAMELEDGILSKAGYALLDDSASYLYDVESGFRARPCPEVDLYFFGYGRDYLGALKDFYHLTGQPPLLPRYALGNWWSRYWPYTSQEYTDLMDRFKAEGVPLAVSVIDMDWHKTAISARFGSGWTGYSWNRDLIPDPAAFLHGLHERGLKVTLNVHPADGIRAFEDAYPMVAKRLGLDAEKEEAASFDFYSPAFREAYFEDVHHPLENQGIDFWWIDWQQGSHGKMDPLWLLNHYHYLDNCRTGQAGLILSRYGGPGSHRYPIGFSGDTIVTWESLAFQPYFTSTASNIGYTWWSHDIGGHMRGYYDEDLALRWLQFGVFSPINRLHSSFNAFNSKEPWFYSPETCRWMKQYLRLRHSLLPYLYTMNVATQYRVNESNVKDAYYKLMRPESQIKSYIEDALRSSVPKLTLDELFEKKDEIALEVQKQVAEEMSTYGYIIVKTLITKVEPDAEVKQSMNEINAAQRKRVAAQELAEADKIKIVTAAEAEAEKDRLHGVGIAEQRKAIVDGLADSIKELKGANVDLTEEQIMSILLTNQYLDTLNNFADKEGNNTIFLPANPDGVENIRTQILSALKAK